jgi:hypothetical protein
MIVVVICWIRRDSDGQRHWHCLITFVYRLKCTSIMYPQQAWPHGYIQVTVDHDLFFLFWYATSSRYNRWEQILLLAIANGLTLNTVEHRLVTRIRVQACDSCQDLTSKRAKSHPNMIQRFNPVLLIHKCCKPCYVANRQVMTLCKPHCTAVDLVVVQGRTL